MPWLAWKTLEWSERITLVSPDSLHILQKQFVNSGGDWMNNKRLLAVVASACLAMLAQPAMAAKGFNYSYAEAGYRNIDSDSVEGDGVEFNLQYGATDYFHILFSYSRLWIDKIDVLSSVDVDLDEYKVGFGGHYPIMDKVDLVAQVAYVDDEFKGKAKLPGDYTKTRISEKEEGYEATFYGRIQAMKKLEMTPHVVYRDVGSDSDTGFGLGLVYKFYKKFSFRIRGTHFSDESTTNLFAGVRFNM
jgi:hypothetical protein